MKSISVIKRRCVRLVILALVIFQVAASTNSAFGANGIWTNLHGGSWVNGANWNGGIIADGSGFIADFSTLNLSASAMVTLDAGRTIGGILFDDQNTTEHTWTLDTGSGGPLTLVGATPTITLNNAADTIGAVIAGTSGLMKAGSGTLTLSGVNTYTGVTTVKAGTLNFLGTVGTYLNQPLVIAAGAVAASFATLNLNVNQNGSTSSTDIYGAGTLRLAATNNSATSPDLYFGPDHSGNAYWGTGESAPLDLGGRQRFVFARTGHNGVGKYGMASADAQFAGTISGAGGITFIAQMTWTASTPYMEVPFCLLASNSFSGTVEIQRGSVYLGNANALTQTNVLFLNANGTDNARFFLYGNNATVANLSSSTSANNVIANGNEKTGATLTLGAATLTVVQDTPGIFSGSIQDVQPEYDGSGTGTTGPLNLVKNGPASLMLAGSNSFSGTLLVNGGGLFVNNGLTGGGTVTVANGTTLGGSGTINAAVTVINAGTLEAGNGNGLGTLAWNSLKLGTAISDNITLNCTADNSGIVGKFNVIAPNALTNNATVTINVGGEFPFLPGAYTLIAYSGSVKGNGTFVAGNLPSPGTGYITNNPGVSAIQLVVVAGGATLSRWSGALSTAWNTNTLSAPKNWVLDSDGVSQIDYLDGEVVRFDDSAVGMNANIDLANVAPYWVTVSNVSKSLTLTGGFGITGMTGLTKQGSGQLVLSSLNTYTGDTTITAGTLTVGSATAIPAGLQSGNCIVNGTLDVGGFNLSINNLSGNGTVENLTAGGSAILTIINTLTNVFSGTIKNSSGTLSVNLAGDGVLTLSGTNTLTGPIVASNAALNVTGQIGSGGVALSGGGRLSGTGVITGLATLAEGSFLVLTANNPLTVGALTLNGKVTVTVAGSFSTSAPGTYALLNHGSMTGSGSFVLAPLPGIFGTGLSGRLNDTGTQLQLLIQPATVTGTIADVRHVVVFVQENRSFDHYFGTLHGVHGFNDRNILTWTNGNNDLYQPSGSGYVLPFHSAAQCIIDTDHSWTPTQNAFDDGWNDQWVPNKGSETMCYYNRADLPYYFGLADAYTVLDDFHCSVRASTNPNRMYVWTGMIDPDGTGGGPVIDNSEPTPGYTWTTYPERLQNAGVSWKVYQQTDNYDDNALLWFQVYKQAVAGHPLYDNGAAFVSTVVTAFQNDVTSNTLPAVSWIIAPTGQSEHPPYSPASGEAFTKQLLDAVASNPAVYTNAVFILTYDEDDGFWDHATPVNPPAGTPAEFVGGLPIGLGVRVPMIIVSPWTRGTTNGGYVCSQVFDHTSLIRFIETWTGVQEPNISAWRRQVCGDLTSAFDFAHPRNDYPGLTPVAPVSTTAVTPTPPGSQSVPNQEAGTLTPRSLPYQPEAFCTLNSGGNTFAITMTNSGPATVHFAVYPNAFRHDGPWPFDVAYTNYSSASFSLATTGGNYDFGCYGPNGFQRRFAGNVNADYNQLEVASSLDPGTGEIQLILMNRTISPINFTITNGYDVNGLFLYSVPAGTTSSFAVGSSTNSGFYDVTVTANADSSFLRRFLGRVETNSTLLNIVTLVPPTISGRRILPGGSFQLTFSGPEGQSYRLMTSTGLTQPGSWTVSASGFFGVGPEVFTDTNTLNQPVRFYRVVSP